ncbi:MAG: AMP-binding protein [Candidatus Staskawiczbacteria bacterium]|nr:AMP-binding protein [Candidatus Staskawiczbacteria bacterium]
MNKELTKIKKIVNFCRKTVPYYKDGLRELKINSLHDFKAIPIILKNDYIDNTPPNNFNMLSRKDSKCFLFSTGGTTSKPKYILRDFKDVESQYLDYSGLNVNENDTVVNLFMPGIWGIFTTANITLMKSGCKIIPYGGTNLNEENCDAIGKLMEDFNVNFLVGVPSAVISIISYLKNANKIDTLKQIDKIFCLGEMVTESTIRYLKEIIPNVKIKSKYGLMESAGIGYQCEYLNGNNYHIFPDRYVEIIGEEPESNKGSIVVTTLNERLVPLIRYKTGDAGILHEKKCKCGQGLILHVLGRNDDEVIFASIHLSINLISSIITDVGQGCSQIFQIVLKKDHNLDCVEIIIEADKLMDREQKKIISDGIMKIIYKEIPEIIDAVNSTKMSYFSVSIVSPGVIERIGSSGKVKKILDLRK